MSGTGIGPDHHCNIEIRFIMFYRVPPIFPNYSFMAAVAVMSLGSTVCRLRASDLYIADPCAEIGPFGPVFF